MTDNENNTAEQIIQDDVAVCETVQFSTVILETAILETAVAEPAVGALAVQSMPGMVELAESQEITQEAPISELESAEDWALHVGLVEAILVASGEPADTERLLLISRLDEDQLQRALATLKERGSHDSSGCELVQVAGKYQLRTKAMFAEYLREIKAEPPRRLSAAALETLAIVAYRQPIVRSDIEKIRGVDCTPTIKTLLERGLTKILGHQASVGQPALYGTTEEFLKLFGLNSLSELPTLRDLQELERDPGESEEVDEEPGSKGESTLDVGEDIRPTVNS